MSYTYLHGDIPVAQGARGDPQCYDWMAIRAGRPSRFCEEVTFGKDIVVGGTINHSGNFEPPLESGVDITEYQYCGGIEGTWADAIVYGNSTDLNVTLQQMSDMILARLEKYARFTPMVIGISDTFATNVPNDPPALFTFDKRIMGPPTAINEELCPYDNVVGGGQSSRDGTRRMAFGGPDSRFFIYQEGIYRVTIQLAVQIEQEYNPATRFVLYAVDDANAPTVIFGQVSCGPSGQDNVETKQCTFHVPVFKTGQAPAGSGLPELSAGNDEWTFQIAYKYINDVGNPTNPLAKVIGTIPPPVPGPPALFLNSGTFVEVECISKEPLSVYSDIP
jgi:hypothetical protein